MSDLEYGLMGEKLGHSFSPAIHRQLGGYDYRLVELPPEELGPFLERGEFRGLNVTIPYKKAVIPYCRELSPAGPAHRQRQHHRPAAGRHPLGPQHRL